MRDPYDFERWRIIREGPDVLDDAADQLPLAVDDAVHQRQDRLFRRAGVSQRLEGFGEPQAGALQAVGGNRGEVAEPAVMRDPIPLRLVR